MNNQSTNILNYPSFFKGVARVADLFGGLDKYRYSENPDSELLQKDWEIVGSDLIQSLKKYERKKDTK